MSAQAIAAARPARPLWLVILAAGTIVGLAMGLRQVMGLYLKPLTTELGIGREPFSNAMAIANLTWGVLTIVAGAVADRYGAGRVLIVSGLATVSSFYLMATAQNPLDLYIAGLLAGAGVAGTGVPALVGAVGRAAPAERRTAAIASLGMASGIGTLIAFPYAHVLIETIGWKASLMAISATCLLILPLAWPLAGKPTPSAVGAAKSQTLVEAFQEAFRHPSFWLLTSGFFVCGFHLAFYGVHLPAFVSDLGMPSWVGVWALMAVGVANIIGTYAAGQSARFIERRVGLSFIYFMRSFAFLGLLFLPLTPWLIIAISALLGLFWLSTVPLTSTLVGIFFGTQWMSMLFGFVFLSHQLGSFAGLWLAGTLYDSTKSYDSMWWISIALAMFAALIHWPIRERPVARLREQPAT
ncbi:MAG: MFS transporter [Hyphomicrobium sp.]|mgnify:FL=1|nr:MFS transporter [Hyphomicrobium sp.]MBN9265592.1 MFS transporter [Hyphomicrobium sp.]